MTTDPYARPSDPAKRVSSTMTDGPDRAGARAMLKGAGFTDEDLARPLIGVATTWIETMQCNLNQRELAQNVKRGIREAGGTPMEFNTISISDGVSMGTEGMSTSLVSREVIADSIELVARGHLFDGLVCLVACDKTNPAAVMALGGISRVDVAGREIVAVRMHGQEIPVGERILPVPIPVKWLERTGEYEIANPGEDAVLPEKVRIRASGGFLFVDFSIPLLFPGTASFSIAPVSDFEAVIRGFGRGMGEPIREVSVNGERMLSYSGYLLKKKDG